MCSILTKLCFVLYVICFDEVHLPSQENKIQNLSQQPTACQKYFVKIKYVIKSINLYLTY